jgi:Uma2 family endonuclease
MESTVTLPEAKGRKKVPAYLVKEEFDGVPLYYKGYRDVLSGEKTLEEIMGCSGIQSLIVTYLTILLGNKLNKKRYRVLTGEVGSLIDKKKSSLDVAIFDKSVQTPGHLNRRYTNVPPKIVIEVDVSVENEKMSDYDIIHFRTDKLLEMGVEKIIWIFTLDGKIMVAEKGKDWLTFDWDRDVEILDGISFNIPQYLDEEGVTLDAI